jgi:hypothetical protein
MGEPQQPELHRSGLSAVDPDSARAHQQVEPHITPGPGEGPGPVPEDNRPGHHPAVEQDKPVEQFVARARELAEEAQEHHDAPPEEAQEHHDAPREEAHERTAAPPEEAHERTAAPPPAGTGGQGAAGVPVAPGLVPEARHTAEADLAAPDAGVAPPRPAPGGGDGDGLARALAPVLAVWGFVREQPAALVAVPPLAAWDAYSRPDAAWDEIDESKGGWVSRIVLVPFVGAWWYATGVRPRLDGAAVALRLRGG